MIEAYTGATYTIGCAWAFYGLMFAFHRVDYENLGQNDTKSGKIVKKLIQILLSRHLLIAFTSIFLILRHIVWSYQYLTVYILPSLIYLVASVLFQILIPEIEAIDFTKGMSYLKLVLSWIIISISSISLMLVLDKLTIEEILFNLLWTGIGFTIYAIGSLLLQKNIISGKLQSRGSWIALFNFLLGICVGIGINKLLGS